MSWQEYYQNFTEEDLGRALDIVSIRDANGESYPVHMEPGLMLNFMQEVASSNPACDTRYIAWAFSLGVHAEKFRTERVGQ